jgi:hypothetical protein
VDKKFDEINLSNIDDIIDEIKRNQKEKLVMEDNNGVLGILKSKDRYVLDMENSLYSSWAFDRLKITGNFGIKPKQ